MVSASVLNWFVINFKHIPWLQILGNNIFLTLEQQFPIYFYISLSVSSTRYN